LEEIREFAEENDFYNLETLFSKKCITMRDFADFQQDLKKALDCQDITGFSTILKDIQYFSNDAEDCIYIKTREIVLYDFMADLVDEYQEERKNDPDHYKGIGEIIERCFENLKYYGPFNYDDLNSITIADILHSEVLEYYGSTCWDRAELSINELRPSELKSMHFEQLVGILWSFCY
jgi:hypothetical protein